jgi:hypothetical protein
MQRRSPPAEEHGGRRDDERAAGEGAERLERLPEAHVVGEEGAEAGVGEEAQPVDARVLVVAELGAEIRGERRARQAREVRHQRA